MGVNQVISTFLFFVASYFGILSWYWYLR